jgi:hypothetical protein
VISSGAGGANKTEGGEKLEDISVNGAAAGADNGCDGGGIVRIKSYEFVEWRMRSRI